MPTFLASSAVDSDALRSGEHDHVELIGGLAACTSALLATARAGRGWQADRDALVAWYRTELVPHVEAEEEVLYPAARGSRQLEPLIRALLHEQALLDDVVGRLESAPDAPSALMHAGAVQTLFETHVAKENDLLLPAIAAAVGVSLADVRADMQAVLERHGERAAVDAAVPSTGELAAGSSAGHSCSCDDDDEPELDARTIPHAIRHATIFGALDAVAPQASLVLVAPHDPLPLLEQIGQRSPGAFDVEYLQRGPEAWRLRFTRAPAALGAG